MPAAYYFSSDHPLLFAYGFTYSGPSWLLLIGLGLQGISETGKPADTDSHRRFTVDLTLYPHDARRGEGSDAPGRIASFCRDHSDGRQRGWPSFATKHTFLVLADQVREPERGSRRADWVGPEYSSQAAQGSGPRFLCP